VTDVVLTALTVRYGKREVVAPLSATVRTGEWLCLIGANGAGKSSILRAIAGLVRHGGTVSVGSEQLHEREAKRRALLVAYVPQSPNLPDDMTAEEYVLLGRNPHIGYFGVETDRDRRIVREVLDRLDLADLAGRVLGTLSGGERQRLVIARALAQEAPVLLLDEPTSALDIGHQQQALELVDRLRRENGLTVLSAMHDLTLAGLYADRLALLDHGHVVAAGTASEVLCPDALRRFYGADVDVHHAADGTVVVVPRRSGRPAAVVDTLDGVLPARPAARSDS
jgi:iron complex transport system ATP-binding protein